MSDEGAARGVTPVLLAETLAPCVEFWARFGFGVTVTVPEAPPFDFAIVQAGGLEIMLQTRASVMADLAATPAPGGAVVYVQVATIESVLPAIEAGRIAVPRRTTFYGADEIWVWDPAGNLVGFAARPG